MRIGIQAAMSLPLGRIAPLGALDRAGANAAVIYVPAFFAGIGIAASGEGGHAPMIPRIGAAGKPLGISREAISNLATANWPVRNA